MINPQVARSLAGAAPRRDRILWGGYDAVYFNGGRIHEEQAQRPRTFAMLAEHFFATFPQLGGSSTRAPGSARSSAPPTAGGWLTRLGTRGRGFGARGHGYHEYPRSI
jgi:hypothetical protein